MQTTEIQITDDEIIVIFPAKKIGAWGIITSIIMFIGIAVLNGILAEKYSDLVYQNFSIIMGYFTGIFLSIRLFFQANIQYTIAIDKKNVYIRNNRQPHKQHVYNVADIRNWCINPKYRQTAWSHIRYFLTRYATGCLAFNYSNMPAPIRIGHELTLSEAEEILNAMRKKGWIENYQLTDSNLEGKHNERYKPVVAILIVIMAFWMLSTIFLIEPFTKPFNAIYIASMGIMIGVGFITAIISYRQEKKQKNKMSHPKNELPMEKE